MKLKVTLRGKSPYSQSKMFESEPADGEGKDLFEKRCWREKSHVNEKGQIVVPPFAIKAMLDSTATYLGIQVPGGGKRTYGKLFVSGIMVQAEEPVLLVDGKPLTRKDIAEKPPGNAYGEWISANSDGKRGSGKRVPRCFPLFRNWSVTLEIEAIDPRITKEVLLRHLAAAGMYKGLGRFRAEVGGSHGRFEVICDGKPVAAQAVERVVDETTEE
jgi:hypothetical protein